MFVPDDGEPTVILQISRMGTIRRVGLSLCFALPILFAAVTWWRSVTISTSSTAPSSIVTTTSSNTLNPRAADCALATSLLTREQIRETMRGVTMNVTNDYARLTAELTALTRMLQRLTAPHSTPTVKPATSIDSTAVGVAAKQTIELISVLKDTTDQLLFTTRTVTANQPQQRRSSVTAAAVTVKEECPVCKCPTASTMKSLLCPPTPPTPPSTLPPPPSLSTPTTATVMTTVASPTTTPVAASDYCTLNGRALPCRTLHAVIAGVGRNISRWIDSHPSISHTYYTHKDPSSPDFLAPNKGDEAHV